MQTIFLICLSIDVFGTKIINNTCSNLIISSDNLGLEFILNPGESKKFKLESSWDFFNYIRDKNALHNKCYVDHSNVIIRGTLLFNADEIITFCCDSTFGFKVVRKTDNTHSDGKNCKVIKNKEASAKVEQSFTFKNLAGDIPEEITEIVDYIKNPERFLRVGAKMYKGILLVGPPGNGKTSIARAIAGEADAAFFESKASDFINVYVGTGPSAIRDLFGKAREAIDSGKNKSAIIFIDEIDAIGGPRGLSNCNEYRNTLTALLAEMDGFKKDENIMIIAATNTPNDIDNALKRPGRFDRIIHIGLPNIESRLAILELYVKENGHVQGVNLANFAHQTEGWSAAELNNLVIEAARIAARKNAMNVTQEHFDIAFEKLLKEKISFR